jgi:TonB family protein
MRRFLLLAIVAVLTMASSFQLANAGEAQLKVTVTGSTDCKPPVWPAGSANHVVLKLRVAADGSVLQGEIASSSGQPSLDHAALEAFSHCRFVTDPNQKEPKFILYTWPTPQTPTPGNAWEPQDLRDAESRGDWETAVKLLRPLAEGGNADAQNSLGIAFEIGRGVPLDYSEAAKWLRKSAEQGAADGQCNFANLYRRGRGVPKNVAEALKWLQKSAAQRFLGAFLNLGHMYRDGDGVPADSVQAYMWYRLASNSATTPETLFTRQSADKYMAGLASKMTTAQVAEAERRARDWKP